MVLEKRIIEVIKWLEFDEIPSLTNPLMRLPKSNQNPPKSAKLSSEWISRFEFCNYENPPKFHNYCADPLRIRRLSPEKVEDLREKSEIEIESGFCGSREMREGVIDYLYRLLKLHMTSQYCICVRYLFIYIFIYIIFSGQQIFTSTLFGMSF